MDRKRNSTHTREQLELPLAYRQQQAVGRAYLALEGTLVSYTIKRSLRRRAISILVDEEGVRVGAPWDATHTAIERLLRKHSAWVLRKLQEWQVRRAPPRRWDDGEALMLLGERYTLRLAADAIGVQLRGRDLCVGIGGVRHAPVGRQVHEWLHRQALACFEDRVAHYCKALRIDGCPQVLLSSARTRWGSCHSSGRIHLNWRLVQMPARLLDYVVAHEVAHLMEMNHSPRFWRVVERLVPDYAACRRELRRDAHKYLLV
jgi:predicted metal-dependent hydrolase